MIADDRAVAVKSETGIDPYRRLMQVMLAVQTISGNAPKHKGSPASDCGQILDSRISY